MRLSVVHISMHSIHYIVCRVCPIGWPFAHQIRIQRTLLFRFGYNRYEISVCVVRYSQREVQRQDGSLSGD